MSKINKNIIKVKIYLINQKKPICVASATNDEIIDNLLYDLNDKSINFIKFGKIIFQKSRVEKVELI